MRICLVADGNEVHVQRLANFLAERGNEVHLVCGQMKNTYNDNVTVHLLAGKRMSVFNFPLRLLKTRKIIKAIHPDIVDGHFLVTYGFLAACSGFHPLVVTAWGSDFLIIPWKSPSRRFYARYAIKKADRIGCLFSLDIAREKFIKLGVDLSRVRTYYMGVDPSEFLPKPASPEVRRELGIGPLDPVVLNPRGLAPVYGVSTFLKAIPLILEQIPGTKFVIVFKDGEEGQANLLKNQTGDLDSIKFIPWRKRSELPELLSTTEVYVSASLSDTASNALFEAMACESAVVVSDIPANQHWIKDGENGLLFQPGDYRALAEKVVLLLRNQEMRRAFGQKNREIVLEGANQEKELPRLEEIYRELLSESDGARSQAMKRRSSG